MSFLDVNIDDMANHTWRKTLCLNSTRSQQCACVMFLWHTALSLHVGF